MKPSPHEAIGTLLTIYADIDLLALELCAARIPKAPSLAAKLELAHQVEEELLHFTLQDRWLKKLGRPFRSPISPRHRAEILKAFDEMEWFDFLTSLQIGIEGIGIAVVELVASRADTGTQKALQIPIRDEKRQTAFGLQELASIVRETPIELREGLALRMSEDLARLYRWAEEILPVPFEEMWEALGISKAQMWEVVWMRARDLFTILDLELVLPQEFVPA